MLRRIILWLLPALLLSCCLTATESSRSFLFAQQRASSVLRELEGSGQGERVALRTSFRSSRAVFQFLSSRMPNASASQLTKLADRITTLGYHYGFPPEFVLSLIAVESNYRHNAVSIRGAVGLLQLKEATAKEIADRMDLPWTGRKGLHDPSQNLELALHYLAELRDRFKEPRIYLSAYNHGPTRISQILRNGQPMPEAYYRKVKQSLQAMRLERQSL